jgi:sterol desaturase/sphingolipid hydroxylase (fatty acid hydroxylase superfamily)
VFRATPDSPKLFDNRFVDAFSRTPWFLVPIIWVPIVCGLIWRGSGQAEWHWVLMQVVLGAGFWTGAEYWLHRTVFHWEPEHALGKRFHFIIHGVHHTWPEDKLRLVMPPAAGMMIAAVFWALAQAAAQGLSPWLSPTWIPGFFGGFLAGYINYDLTHYAIHHVSVKSMRLKRIRAHHMSHHYNTPERKYGFTSLLWDRLFGTL